MTREISWATLVFIISRSEIWKEGSYNSIYKIDEVQSIYIQIFSESWLAILLRQQQWEQSNTLQLSSQTQQSKTQILRYKYFTSNHPSRKSQEHGRSCRKQRLFKQDTDQYYYHQKLKTCWSFMVTYHLGSWTVRKHSRRSPLFFVHPAFPSSSSLQQ